MAKIRNSLTDLNEYLFEALDVISNSDLKGEELNEEITRIKTITTIAQTIINNANMMISASKEARMCAFGEGQTSAALKLLGEGQIEDE